MKIKWNTNVNAPCCPGEIVAADGRTRLIQTDWDFPHVAETFDWSKEWVQKCSRKTCGHVHLFAPEPHDDGLGDTYTCPKCKNRKAKVCNHDGTDGTIACGCGVTPTDFIASAREWLEDEENNGAEAEDPGYFTDS